MESPAGWYFQAAAEMLYPLQNSANAEAAPHLPVRE
jgi:hypothetical protein